MAKGACPPLDAASALARFDALEPPERAVLEFLSLFYAPATKTNLLDALRWVAAPGPRGKAWSAAGLSEVLAALERAGLAVSTPSGPACLPALRGPLTGRLAAEPRFGRLARAVTNLVRPPGRWAAPPRSYDEVLRDLRLSLLLGDREALGGAMTLATRHFPLEFEESDPWWILAGSPFDAAFVDALPEDLKMEVLRGLFRHASSRLVAAPVALEYLAERARAAADNLGGAPLRLLAAQELTLRGDLQAAAAVVSGDPTVGAACALAWIDLLRGGDARAVATYEAALAAVRAHTRKRKAAFEDLAGLWYPVALLRTRDPSALQRAGEYLGVKSAHPRARPADLASLLHVLLQVLAGRLLPKEAFARLGRSSDAVHSLLRAFVAYWLGAPRAAKEVEALRDLGARAGAAGYRWIEAEAASLLGEWLDADAERERGSRLHAALGTVSLVGAVAREEPWVRTLDALRALALGEGTVPSGPAPARLAWVLGFDGDPCTLAPLEQKRTAKGGWTRGKAVALARLLPDAERPEWLTAQDRAVCDALQLRPDPYRPWGPTRLAFNLGRALPALVGHPLVFFDERLDAPIEVARGEVELVVAREGRRLRLSLVPAVEPGHDVALTVEPPDRVVVIEATERQRKLAGLLAGGLSVPASAEERLLPVLGALAGVVTVHSAVGAGVGGAEEVPADGRPHLLLTPQAAGLRVELRTRPFGQGGPIYRPGQGGRTVLAQVEGRRLQTHRDLDAERRDADEALFECALLVDLPGEYEWTVSDPEDCLELLQDLQRLGDRIVVEWPEGKRLEAPRPVGAGQLALRIRRDRDWFSAEGEVAVDESLRVGLVELLEALGRSRGRFVALEGGRFLALSEAFRRRLEDLRAIGEPGKRGVGLHPLAAGVLEELAAEAGSCRGDREWKRLLERAREAEELDPAVPSSLQAELRPYQLEGYRWLMRLGHWGAGACLADDMGLGKTLQALALLLARAPAGPALVVAPTSVCANWQAEAQRFAPTLRVIPFGGGDRGEVLAALKPFDVLVTSYGLLLQEAERLSAVEWESVVLDEAQAIKNVAAKRSQAAMELKARFRLATTGTPVENHLGELWNLFRFLNPGLLGSLERFSRRFAVPIERDGDKAAQHRLKRLVGPFLFRRTKSQVLEDLPPRTEIVRRVELGPEERALYEGLRRQAVERMAGAAGPAGQVRIQVLAELMRLRRACCNPRLVAPEGAPPSAKLEAFGEILDELLENRHKALVFSQFVDHLRLVREEVERRGISYQYLDGSTPPAERRRRVAAFQAGEGELFLISLKAGGLGLNLTAADYVIHLDPWWNPAVEDQASDRAHRIGQTRPVTIYRLVAKDTVEEKIVALHHQKRDLADALLEGADAAGRVSVEELLRLLEEG